MSGLGALTLTGAGLSASASGARAATTPPTSSPLIPGLALTSDQPWHLARRTAHAATEQLVTEIRQQGAGAWVRQQVYSHQTIDDSFCDSLMQAHFPWLSLTPEQLITATGDRAWIGAPHVARATMVRQLFSRRVVHESMVEFFGDLLYVPFTSDKTFSFMIDYDREVIRKFALGKYRLMLRAALTHPALLIFLDNTLNTRLEVNENLGRELLELYTVGARDLRSGEPLYTEADVRDSSLLLTGHSRDGKGYVFLAPRHHVGPLAIMGFTHLNDVARRGPTVLTAFADYLATHPATARRLVTRLCVRFVSDAPSESLVDDLVAVYLANDTDLRPVLNRLFSSAEFKSSIGLKVRRPAEFTASAVRASRPTPLISSETTRFPKAALRDVAARLEACGHAPRAWPVVDGYPDTADHWTSTQATLGRLQAAFDIAAQVDPEMPCAQSWATILAVQPGQRAIEAAQRVFLQLTGFQPSTTHRDALAAFLIGQDSLPSPTVTLTADDIAASLSDGVALVLASPYFSVR